MVTNDPKYDTDAVNLRFLNKRMSEEKESSNKELSFYGKNFSSPPNPPYYKGWTYTSNDKIYRCINDRKIGNFNESDWIIIYNGKQNKLISENFLYLSEIELIEQSDGKIETFYQEEDPSKDWQTTTDKSIHEGDYWRTKKDNVYYSYVYTKFVTNPITYGWVEIQVPLSIFNTIMGHRNIFISIPETYQKDDFLKISNDDMKNYFSADLSIGTFLYAKKDNSIFEESDWELKDDEMSLKSMLSYYSTTEEINKILEVTNKEIQSDIVKSKESITAYVKEEYTEKTTTEKIKKTVDANGKLIDEIRGSESSETTFKNLAQLTLELDQIMQKISKTIDLTNTVENIGYCEILNAAEGNLLELNIKGSFSILFPSNNLFPSKLQKLKNNYLTVEHEDNTISQIKLPIIKMRKLGEIEDEFVITTDKTYLIKRIGITEQNIEYVLPEEEIIEYDLLTVPLKEGRNKIYMWSFQDSVLNFKATYCIKNEFTNLFATKIEMATKILETSEGILMETARQIETATGTEELIAKINMKPGEIDMTGTVTANGNTKINTDGTFEAVNGKFKGHIEAESGSFKGDILLDNGGKIVSENGLMTNLIYPGTVSSSNFIITGDFSNLGFSILRETYDSNYNPIGVVCKKDQISFSFCLPKSFIITEAKIFLQHIPMRHYANDGYTVSYDRMGYSRNLRLYKKENISYRQVNYVGDVPENINSSLIEIPSAFGSTGFNPSSSGLQSTESIDIKNYIKTNGVNNLIIQSANTVPSNTDSAREQTGACMATLQIIGYTKFDL